MKDFAIYPNKFRWIERHRWTTDSFDFYRSTFDYLVNAHQQQHIKWGRFRKRIQHVLRCSLYKYNEESSQPTKQIEKRWGSKITFFRFASWNGTSHEYMYTACIYIYSVRRVRAPRIRYTTHTEHMLPTLFLIVLDLFEFLYSRNTFSNIYF